MRLAIALVSLIAIFIAAFWWWVGAPVAMRAPPLGAGEKLYCVSYSPFRGRATPLDPPASVDPRRIDEDLARLSRLTDGVRSYATNQGLDRIPEIAGRHGLKVMLGVWLGRDARRNRQEIDTAVGLAQRHPGVIRSIVVGNEVLLRGEIAPGDLANIIRTVKAQVQVPVTYADVWEFWLRHREVFAAVDFVTIHILPYWEDFPIPADQAPAHLASIRRKVAENFPGKDVLVGEAGWPSAGRMREGALPSRATQARVIHDFLAVARRENFHINLIEAFDEPWKEALEGAVGGHWGILDGATREPKFAWGGAVSNHPHWGLQAAGGIVLAVLVLGCALASRRYKAAREPTP